MTRIQRHNRDCGSTDTVKRRLHARRPCQALCRIGAPQRQLRARLIDVSVSGARCEISGGPVPNIGESVLLEWPDATAVFAIVIWRRDGQIGLALDHMTADVDDRVDTASLGLESYSRILLLQPTDEK
ncbi:MAG: PilZ domain-containing protein [Hyphomicrobium sp.]|nr:PilZ domain-containing protein [Hyphomicrobium sp.]